MLKMDARIVEWSLKEPFKISRETLYSVRCIQVSLQDEAGHIGRGEAVGVDYAGETPEILISQIEAVRGQIEAGLSLSALQLLLSAGGARNAVDCALWDLNAKQSGIPAWMAAGLTTFSPKPTAFSFGIMSEESLRKTARLYAHFPVLKIKTNREYGLDPVKIVHEEAPNSRLIVDPNQAWDLPELAKFANDLLRLNVALLEQPVAIDNDAVLERISLPVPVAADEAFNVREDIERIARRYQVLNIKLDKTGGLTEALACARFAQKTNLKLMIGCMIGSSLSMAPGTLIAQLCDYVDLDGPLLQAEDCSPPIHYEAGQIYPPNPLLWG
jgi:L-Ala-D/L-Glu epimerase